jgi:ParB family transcriptional regulator, chromosome partitioning protein
METDSLLVDGIRVSDRMRRTDPEAVAALSESISKIGLISPITVYTPDDGDTVILIAGAHRLEAYKKLGIEFIDCFVIDAEESQAQIIEIDENLCRHELTPTEIAEHIAKRKQLWEARKAQETGGATCATSLSDGRAAGPQHDEGFAAETAKASGKDKSTVNRAAKRGSEVCQEARDIIRGTKLDTGKTLDKLVKMEPSRQVEWAHEQLDAIADKERLDALNEERKQREIEAKELREAAHMECMNFLCDMMSGRQWAQLIDLVERSGGSIKSSQLRKWQSP